MDAAAKEHRFLTETEMFSIVESSETDLRLAMPKLDEFAAKIFDGGMYEPGTYARLVHEKVYDSATIRNRKGKPMFVLIYTVSRLGWLFVEAVASIERSSLRMIFEAVDVLATHYHCKTIQCVTKLSGMLRYSQTAGYKPAGIIILKNARPA